MLLLLRDPILKVRTHASLGQLCYVNEVNRRPADGRVTELAPPSVPQQSRAVLEFFSIMASWRASTLPLEWRLLTSGSSTRVNSPNFDTKKTNTCCTKNTGTGIGTREVFTENTGTGCKQLYQHTPISCVA